MPGDKSSRKTRRQRIAPEAAQVGSRVVAVRKSEGLSQVELSKRVGVSSSHLATVERGESRANLEIMMGIAREFPHVSVSWLLTGNGQMHGSTLCPIDTEMYKKVTEFVALRSRFISIKPDAQNAFTLGSYYTALLYSRAALKSGGELERDLQEGAKVLRALYNILDLVSMRRELQRDDLPDAERKQRELLAEPLEKKYGDVAGALEGHTIAPGSQLEQAFIEDRLEDILGRRVNDL